MVYPFTKFQYLANIIIDNLEGGYYHPDMFINGAKNTSGKFIPASSFLLYKYSGETLFGLDRHAGHDMWYSSKRLNKNPQQNLQYIYSNVYKFIDNDAKNFWTTLDKLNARKNWAWNYFGGKDKTLLKDLCIKMMYNYFNNFVWKKLDDKGKLLVINDDKLALNYIYSAWNGIGYSNYYNKIFNEEIKNNNRDSISINNKILIARSNSNSGIIRDSATRLKNVFSKIVSSSIPILKKNSSKIIAGLIPIVIIVFLFRKKIFK